MAVFRIEKTRDYTVMSNHHLKNKNLTLKAKGLMSLLLSLPDNWVHTLAGLAQISVEGVDAIRMAVHELEREGYVVRNRIRDEKGHLGEMEYVVYENPQKPVVAEEPVPASPTLEEPMLENPTQENPTQGNPTQDKPTLGHPTQENPMLLNTHRSNTHKENIDLSIPYAANPYQSIPYPSTPGREQPSMVAQYKALVQSHIEYDVMRKQYGEEQLDEIVYLIVEVLCSKAQYFTISGEELPADLVRERLLKFRSSHLQYVFDCLNKTTSRVGNIKSYLLTTLYNATATMKSYYDAAVRHDHPYLFCKED